MVKVALHNAAKETIRGEMLVKRGMQAQSTKLRKDSKILGQLLLLQDFRNAKEFFTYISHGGEVGTDRLMKKFLGVKKIVVPKVESGGKNSSKICLLEIKDISQFLRGRFGIREPKVCVPHSTYKSIDVAIVPGIAFDKTGHRIGFGGGYFDRLLKKMHCTTIGLAYEFQIIDKVPNHRYDVAVDFIITEKRVIRCGKKSDKSFNPLIR